LELKPVKATRQRHTLTSVSQGAAQPAGSSTRPKPAHHHVILKKTGLPDMARTREASAARIRLELAQVVYGARALDDESRRVLQVRYLFTLRCASFQ
jgi:hypothetical protein